MCSVFIVWSIGGAALTGTGIAGAQAQAVPLQVKLGDLAGLLDLVQRYGPSLWNSFKEWSTRASSGSSSSASSGPSCTSDCSTAAPADDPDLFGTYSCADLPPSAPTGAYEFPLRPKYCSPHLKSVLLYCKQGKTAVFNPSDEVPQYELRPPYKKLKDTHLPPYIQDLFFEFQGDCLDTRSPVGCANHSPPLGVTTIGGTNFYMLRYHRCQSCATSLVVRIPNYLHATEVEINAFVFSSLKFPAVLQVHGDRYDQHESVGVSACQETNRFATGNKEGCVCCGTNACFADTLRQPHNPSEEVKIPSRGLGYDLPVVRRNQPHCSPLAVDVSTNGLPSAVITVLMSGKSGGLGGWPNSDQGFPAVGTGGEIYEMWISKVLSPPKKH